MTSLTERLRLMLAEAQAETETLEAQRDALRAERDAEIAVIRERFGARIGAIETELTTVKRLERALNPVAPTPAREPEPQAPPQRARIRTVEMVSGVSDRVLRETLAAIAGGADIVPLISEQVDFSRGSVENAIPHLRTRGLIRLTGERKSSPGSPTKARTYAATPEGEAFLEAALSTNGASA
jgi:hypothetical protein